MKENQCRFCHAKTHPNNSLIKLKDDSYVCLNGCLKLHKNFLIQHKLINENSYYLKLLDYYE